MYAEELKPPKDIKIKFYRLNSPRFNELIIPLNGLYNPFDNIESEEYSLSKILKNFDISSNHCANIENLLGVNNQLGKLLVGEDLEGLLTLTNNSDHEIIIKDLKIIIKNEDKLESKKKVKEQPLDIKLPNNYVKILPYNAYTIKIKIQIRNISKHIVEIDFNSKSSAYDTNYSKMKQRTLVKDNTENYSVTGGVVQFFNHTKLNLEITNPFKIIEKFHNLEVNKCLIEILILNQSPYPLTIYDLYLSPKEKKEEKIMSYKNIEQIKNISNDSKYLMLLSEEQIILLFKIDNPDLIYDEEKFVLNIYWLKYFDFIPKLFKYEFSNNLNTYNDYYKMTIIEKPKGDIIINQNFKIIINLKRKKTNKKYIITLSQEPIKDKDSTNDREIEIIDIIEKKMELNSKTPANNFVLICKSDVLGNVHLPKLKFSLYEGDKNNPIENIYNGLLVFNCISKYANNINE